MFNSSDRFLFSRLVSGFDEFGQGNVTINWRDDPLDEFAVYAGAYHRAAEKLMVDLLSNSSFHDIDPCPIVFLYRHSVELYLKAICLLGYKLFQLLDQRLLFNGNDLNEENLFKKHELVPLIKVVKQVFDKLGGDWNLTDKFNHFKTYNDFESVIHEMDDLDSGSYTFRYPYDKKTKKASLNRDFSFNMSSFQEKMNIIVSVLAAMHTDLDRRLEMALEERYLQQEG